MVPHAARVSGAPQPPSVRVSFCSGTGPGYPGLPRRSQRKAFPHRAPAVGRTRSRFGALAAHAANPWVRSFGFTPCPALSPGHPSLIVFPPADRLPSTISAADLRSVRLLLRLRRFYAAVRPSSTRIASPINRMITLGLNCQLATVGVQSNSEEPSQRTPRNCVIAGRGHGVLRHAGRRSPAFSLPKIASAPPVRADGAFLFPVRATCAHASAASVATLRGRTRSIRLSVGSVTITGRRQACRGRWRTTSTARHPPTVRFPP